MADKNTGVGRERIGARKDEAVTGRESTVADRIGDYTDTPSGDRTAATAGTSSTTYSSSPNRDAAPDGRTREIRAEIEQTREDLSETVNAIQDRLRPGNIASNAADTVKHAARERVRDIADTESVQYVRSNPIPTAMIGVGLAGLAWLLFGGKDADRRPRYRGASRDWRVAPSYGEGDDYYRRSTGASTGYEASSAYGTAGYDAASGGYGTTSGAYGTAGATGYAADYEGGTADYRSGARGYSRESSSQSYGSGVASDATRRAKETAHRAQTQVQRTWNDSPLLIGAAAAVLGAIVGAAVPETDRENRLMGETRDNMIEGVQQAVKDKVEDVQNVATKAVSQVQNAVGIATDDKSDDKSGDQSAEKSGDKKPGGTRQI